MDIKLGILGGLGPAATTNFMNRILEMTDASIDQQHIDMLVFNAPSIPDRTAYIEKSSEAINPLYKMKELAVAMEMVGIETIVIPCVTAHYFYDEIMLDSNCRGLNIIKETANYLKERCISKVGVLATDGTIKSQLFQRLLETEGIAPIIPSVSKQSNVMDIIYKQIKCGKAIDIELFNGITKELFDLGAQVIILGCTELSIIKNSHELKGPYLDVIDVLAQRCVQEYGELKEEYKELITH